jgi:DnaJ-domain-containing protein 1
MNNEIARRTSPEEEELARKREELALLQAELAERELFLTNLRAELSAFEGQYLRQVGTLYAELDEWNAKIAEQLAEEEGTEESRSAAAQARTQAEESDSAVHGEAAKARAFIPSAELRALYRQVAKRVHPDLATDQADRQKREHLMAAANAAYQRGDADPLRRILEEYESSPESVRGAGIAADLVRVIRQIEQVRRRLSQIELEIATLIDSDIAKLRAKADAARAEGRELLTEMAEDVRRRIDVARRRFEAGSVARTKA